MVHGLQEAKDIIQKGLQDKNINNTFPDIDGHVV